MDHKKKAQRLRVMLNAWEATMGAWSVFLEDLQNDVLEALEEIKKANEQIEQAEAENKED